MPHVRTQIRDAVVAALTGLTTTGARVHGAYARPKGAAALPMLVVGLGPEEVEQGAQRTQSRQAELLVSGYAKATDNLDDTLETLLAEVESAAAAAGTLGGLVPGGLVLRRIDKDFSTDLDQPAGVIEIAFTAGYHTRAGQPGAII